MNIVVLFKLVPDLVEELNIDELGTGLNQAWLRLIINESDDHAIEQAILLKERGAARVTVVGPDSEDAMDVFFAAAAKGADRLIRLTTNPRGRADNHALAFAAMARIKDLEPDLILTGVQAPTDLDGSIGPLLAEYLGAPYVGYVSGVKAVDGKLLVKKEYPGGLVGEMEVQMPAVLGIQAAEQPPRYVAVSKVRQAAKTAMLEKLSLPEAASGGEVVVRRMFKPEVTAHAEMIKGDPEEVAGRLVAIFKEAGVL
jgi:electron transfer flavoprotein beta subunit